MSEARVRILVAGGLLVLAAACLAIKLLYPFNFITADSPEWILHRLLPCLRSIASSWSLSSMVIFPFGMLVIFLLERWFPAIPEQKMLGTGLVHDSLWVLIQTAIWPVLLGSYSGEIFRIYTRHMSFLSLPVPQSIPVVVRLAMGALFIDFARWCLHWLNHHVVFLWPFHAVHHSQREINMFSDFRIHILEQVMLYTLLMLPMLMLNLQAPAVTWWILLLSWHSRLYHSNIRTNFGPLRYLIVTPQSHRIHHSRRPEHFDQNYGGQLSIWDHLFGTQCREYDVYPETGVDDEKFPAETGHSVSSVLLTPIRQNIYPFRQLWISRNRTDPATVLPGLAPAEDQSRTANA